MPGARQIPDPDAELRRLAALREDPAWREWAVRHADGAVTVRVDGHAFPSRREAETGLAACTGNCEYCDGPHAIVYRDRQEWRDAP